MLGKKEGNIMLTRPCCMLRRVCGPVSSEMVVLDGCSRVAPARTELYRSRSVLTSGWRGDNPRLHTGLDLVIRSAPSPVRSVACRAGHCRISGLRLTDAPLTDVGTHSRRTLDRVLSQRGRASRRTLAHVL